MYGMQQAQASGQFNQQYMGNNMNRLGMLQRGSENNEAYTYNSNNQLGRYDYSEYGGYDYNDKTAKNLGYTYGSYAGYGKQCPGISIALLLITLLGVALMGYILWSKIVAAGRKKRDVTDMDDYWWFVDNFSSLLINGKLACVKSKFLRDFLYSASCLLFSIIYSN